ncbi:4-diphosphocytidyl-2C-methyl-D-erythritolkinase [Beutenbergia cavernae DSM 12333]|uniref:4-diphosphocytidyl-2-C-methyl-D-erythritol kinase n=1 Tax=Beutenbergia cavernae (strain ATCC BAA-8 / DSM 12333 / CCUG 43141 / JCM 11478 / NBRC 16432 / NCIMB 13614 / HKI 0122) TaxID=471853 RepID=C5C051_BEUC1|nr:4-(cytidine 5'-diphospho)-2-C-methyl-D-erythritol kinase [Beutenbergia cavernae]ACQ79237.1 4-diphosphocytidyl-2C-methyl-D-erythritolkinase [Beutenbergia cavernae DSM 12333]
MSAAPDSAPRVHVRAPGKINLVLRCGAPGEDGYHRLATVFQAVSLYEDVVAELADDVTVTVTGRQADVVPTDGENLAVRAARLLADSTGTAEGVRLHVTKNVPVSGGMGGGSADAAATLLACDLLWGTGLARDELAELAAELGADVPFALTGQTAVGTGRGDVLAPALARGTHHWVLATQSWGLPTPEVYARFDELRPDPAPPRLEDGLMAALVGGSSADLADYVANDLADAAVALRPELAGVLDAFDAAGALARTVSGSGPTVFGLAADLADAQDVAASVRDAGVADDVLLVTGPVSGARALESMRGV